MRRAGRIVAQVLRQLSEMIEPEETTTGDLDVLAEQICRNHGVEAAFKGYRGYPASLCTSVNEQVVHGIPGARKLRNGDILGMDFGVKLDGCYADAAITVPIGDVSEQARRLIDVTRESLYKGIAAAVPGNTLGDIGAAIQSHVEAAGFHVVRDLVGHGVGLSLHEDPSVPNVGKPGQGAQLKPGMTLAIEPMINAGTWRVRYLSDRWTVVAQDGGLSAHFEHTIAIREDGNEILTLED